jgi:hypothetical protein
VAVVVDDFTGDGKPDLVTAQSPALTVKLWQGIGDGTLTAPQVVLNFIGGA